MSGKFTVGADRGIVGQRVTIHTGEKGCGCHACQTRARMAQAASQVVRNEQTDRERYLAKLDSIYSEKVVTDMLAQVAEMAIQPVSGTMKATLDQLVGNTQEDEDFNFEPFTFEPSKPSGKRTNAAPQPRVRRDPFDRDMSDYEDFELPPPGMRTNSLTGKNPYSTYNPNGK